MCSEIFYCDRCGKEALCDTFNMRGTLCKACQANDEILHKLEGIENDLKSQQPEKRLSMQHIWAYHKPGECTNPESCQICDGGLGLCVVCGGAEGELTTDCYGSRLNQHILDAVYKGGLDYKDSSWYLRERNDLKSQQPNT